jgi:5'-3' exonuclease
VSTRLYLVDASPYIFRAYFSLPDTIVAPNGAPTNAVYGFAGFLIKLIAEERPTHLAVCFDASLTTSFRSELYPGYKAQRALPPAELELQQERCRDVAAALGAAVFVDRRFEADDLIATLLDRVGRAAVDAELTVVVSSDKDLAQLVGPKRILYDFARRERLDEAEVRRRFGIEPSQIPDLLALAGDPVDNIPGVSGVGRKTAAELLRALGSVEKIFRDLGAVDRLGRRGGVALRQRLEEQRDKALLSLLLARVSTQAPVTAKPQDLRYSGPRVEEWRRLGDELGFADLVERGLRLATMAAR